MTITTYFGFPSGHSNFDFVDIPINKDLRLFIDPCLIERNSDFWSRQASELISDFSDKMYSDIRSGQWHNTCVFDHAHEINATHLGYGNGHNGKGKTTAGMHESLDKLCDLTRQIPTITCIQDIPVFIKDFAEDCMSDLLSNILHLVLSHFTAAQMEKYGISSTGEHSIYFWNSMEHCWSTTSVPYWTINHREVLLVPKVWVRKNFLFSTEQYLRSIIVERMQRDPEYDGLTKKDILKNMERINENWRYDQAVDYTTRNPDALDEYHDFLPISYSSERGHMSDEDLDFLAYKDFQ